MLHMCVSCGLLEGGESATDSPLLGVFCLVMSGWGFHVERVAGFVDFQSSFGEFMLEARVAECLVNVVGHRRVCGFVLEAPVPL